MLCEQTEEPRMQLNDSIALPILKRSSRVLLFPALAPALGGTGRAEAAFGLAAVVLVAVALTGIINMVLAVRISRIARLVCTVAITVTCASLYGFFLEANNPAVRETLNVFLPLTGINILVLRQCVLYEGAERRHEYRQSLWLSVLFVVLLSALGGLREILLTGELLDTAILAIDLSFFGEPAGLLIVVGTVLAARRALRRTPAEDR